MESQQAEQSTLFEEPKLPAIVLNAGQEAAKNWIVNMVLSPSPEYRKVLLEGPAGTGKTTTTDTIIRELRERRPGIAIGMTAPTHKAVKQLKKFSNFKDKLDFGTIHSFLKLKEVQKPNPKNKREYIITYEPDWDSQQPRKIDQIDVLIVDESSMLGLVLYEYIEEAIQGRPDLRVIFIGDGLQIPPVKNKNDPDGTHKDAVPFIESQRRGRLIYHLKLDEIVRQAADNPIIAYATKIRLNYKAQYIDHNFTHTEDSGVEVISRSKIALDALLLKYFDTPEFRANADYVKVVAWRIKKPNDTVAYFNRKIRLLINKVDILPDIIVGDKLLMMKPLLKGTKIVLAKNEEFDVKETQVVSVPVKYKSLNRMSSFERAKAAHEEGGGMIQMEQDFKVYRCNVETPEGKVYLIDILHEDDKERFDTLREETRQSALKADDMYDRKTMWGQFYALEKVFANVMHNYACTVHTAQGSTYDYTISMEWDIMENYDFEERNRIKYVAATRSRKKLFIIQ